MNPFVAQQRVGLDRGLLCRRSSAVEGLVQTFLQGLRGSQVLRHREENFLRMVSEAGGVHPAGAGRSEAAKRSH